jgi:hypothetical protein
MNDPGLSELKHHPEYLLLLEAYRDCDRSVRDENPEFDGWLPRLNEIDGIAATGLSRAHGRLICHGYLAFQLGDRLEGIKYQLSPDGVRLLGGTASADLEGRTFEEEPEQRIA